MVQSEEGEGDIICRMMGSPHNLISERVETRAHTAFHVLSFNILVLAVACMFDLTRRTTTHQF